MPQSKVVREVAPNENEPGLVSKGPLGSAADALSDAIRAAEQAIRAQGFAVYASIEIDSGQTDEEDPYTAWSQHLAFGKRENRWGLYLTSGPDCEPEHWGDADLYAATIEDRMRAARKIPELVQRLSEIHATQLNKIQSTADAVLKFAAELNKAKTEQDRRVVINLGVQGFSRMGE